MSKTLLYGATKVDETNAAYAAIESLSQFQWKNRVLVIFSDSDNSRAARQENQLLADRPALEERDMIVLKVSGNAVRAVFGSAEPVDAGALRDVLDAPDTGTFHAALIGKDGNELRVTCAATLCEIAGSIVAPQSMAEREDPRSQFSKTIQDLQVPPLPDDLARLGLKSESGSFTGAKGKPDRSVFLLYYSRAK